MIQLNWWKKREPTRPGYYMVERARKKKGKGRAHLNFTHWREDVDTEGY
jgi:hypothetical protein